MPACGQPRTPLRFEWGRELLAASIALAGVGVGLWFAQGTQPRRAGESRRGHRSATPSPDIDSPSPAATAASISPRERRVLDLLAQGCSNKEIARGLGVSENTVKTHLVNLYAKFGARRRTEAVAAARRHGVIVS